MQIFNTIKRKLHTFMHTERILTKKMEGTFIYRLLPDKVALDFLFYNRFGRKINWKNPKTFCEKLQWLKMYNRNPLYTKLVDKYEVKKWVAEKIGSQFIIPTYGVWDSFDEIDFSALPDQFVLKTTHGGGSTGVVICCDKKSFNYQDAKIKITKSLRCNTYVIGREWPYKNVKRRIIAERYIQEKTGGLVDYKVMCFNGEPKLIQVHLGRFTNQHTQDFYDIEWKKTNITQGGYSGFSDVILNKPACFDEMIRLSKQLSVGIPHVRVDWYIVDGSLYFGELTFFDSSGFEMFDSNNDEELLGSWIHLPIDEEIESGKNLKL